MTPLEDGAQFGEWKSPGQQLTVEYDRAVMNQIAAAVMGAFQAGPGLAVEVGGVLYGEVSPERIRIRGWRQAARGSSELPRLSLTEAVAVEIGRLLGAPNWDPRLRGLVPLGWAQSTNRRSMVLADAAAQVFDRFFKEPWQVALIIRPAYQRPTMAAFFVRDASGQVREGGGAHEFKLLDPGEVPVASPDVAQMPPPAEPELSLAPEPQPARRFPRWWLLVIGLLVAAGAAWFLAPAWLGGSAPPAIRLAVSDRDHQLRVSWAPDSDLVRESAGAVLEIVDAGNTVRRALGRKEIASGEFLHRRAGEDVLVRLTFQRLGKAPVAESIRFLGRPGGQGDDNAALRQRIRELESELEKSRREARAEANRANQFERAYKALQQRLDPPPPNPD